MATDIKPNESSERPLKPKRDTIQQDKCEVRVTFTEAQWARLRAAAAADQRLLRTFCRVAVLRYITALEERASSP